MVTLEDVAALAGVSRATVSRVVNGDSNVKAPTREKVERAVAQLGYTPNPAARALASSHSNTLGLVTTSYRGGFFGALMDFVQTEAESHGKQLLVTQGRNSAENEWQAIQRLFSLRCDGVILHVRFLSDDRLRQLAAEQRDFVLLDRLVPGLEARCVTFDHPLASRMATQQLLDAGHRRIACISGPRERRRAACGCKGLKRRCRRQISNRWPAWRASTIWKAVTAAPIVCCSKPHGPAPSTAATKRWRSAPCWQSTSTACGCRRISP